MEQNNLINTEMERNVISACIFDTNTFYYVQDILTEDIFTSYECRKAYEAIRRLDNEGKSPTYMEVDMLLRKDKVNVTYFVTENLQRYEETRQLIMYLKDLSIRRRLSSLFSKGINLLCDPTITIEEIQSISKEYDSIMCDGAGENIMSFGGVLGELTNNIAERKEGKCDVGIMTGLRIFDSRFGWHGGDLVVVAGAPSAGKSTLATTIAYNMAAAGVPCAYYSMEMSSKQLVARMIARKVGLSSSTILYDKLSDDEFNKLYDGSIQLKQLPVYFDENSKTSFRNICNSIRRLVKGSGVKVVFLDYLQILANGKGDNREELLGDMARDMKRMAVELNICVVVLSQLNRSGDREKEPSLSQMRGSGQIEEACDIGVLIQRPKKDANSANILLRKGRNIGLATERVKFNGSLSYFCDYEDGDPQAGYQEHKENLPF